MTVLYSLLTIIIFITSNISTNILLYRFYFIILNLFLYLYHNYYLHWSAYVYIFYRLPILSILSLAFITLRTASVLCTFCFWFSLYWVKDIIYRYLCWCCSFPFLWFFSCPISEAVGEENSLTLVLDCHCAQQPHMRALWNNFLSFWASSSGHFTNGPNILILFMATMLYHTKLRWII